MVNVDFGCTWPQFGGPQVMPDIRISSGRGIGLGRISNTDCEEAQQLQPDRAVVFPSIPSNNGRVTVSVNRLFQSLLLVNPGVFIGDVHTDFNCKEFIVSRMAFFRQQGVSLFFMEMFESSAQPMLDRYFQTGNNEGELLQYLSTRWTQRPGLPRQYLAIVREARAQGIRVIGIDENQRDSLSRRLETSNPHWHRIIRSHTGSSFQGRYIVFGGIGHSANYSCNKGIDYRLGIPSIDMETGIQEQALIGDRRENDFRLMLPQSSNQPY